MKIAICEFRSETNSFNPSLSDMQYFVRGGIYEGHEMYEALHDKPCAVGGMIQAAEQAGASVFTLYSMNGSSGGPVDDAVLNHFLEKTISQLRLELPIDGLFVSLHGATQSATRDDACGYLHEQLRIVVGMETIIVASCDLHANITKLMQSTADFICGYHTYPHVDFYETGYRAATLALTALKNKKKLYLVRTEVPMIVPASSYTTSTGPFGELMSYAESLVEDGQLLDFSIFQMQPWLDVALAGSSIIAIANNKLTAQRYAMELAQRLFAIRNTFTTQLFTIDEVIAKAEKNNVGKPIILVDAADSSNAGACGDSPVVISHILKHPAIKAAVYINDFRAINEIYSAGTGADIDLLLGASKSDLYYQPIEIHAHVRSLHDGFFISEGPASKGMINNIGKTAVLTIGNTDILVCEGIASPGDPQIYRHFGIEPKDYQLVVVKACTSFRAAYEKFALEICETDTPGVAPIVLERLNFKRLPKTFFPFVNIDRHMIPTPA
jgi:microcystin degradation protein MlrC